MQVVVNGDSVEVSEGITVSALLNVLQIGRERVAVEVNREIVPKAQYDVHVLMAADAIEIVHFVGGG